MRRHFPFALALGLTVLTAAFLVVPALMSMLAA